MLTRTAHRVLFTLASTLIFVSAATAHSITLGQRAKIGDGPELQPGKYKVEVAKKQDSTQVSFIKGGDPIATVPAKLTVESTKCRNTEIHSEHVDGQQVITKIRLAGSNESLVFRADATEAE